MNKKDRDLKRAKERLTRASLEFESAKQKGTSIRRFAAAQEEYQMASAELKRLCLRSKYGLGF